MVKNIMNIEDFKLACKLLTKHKQRIPSVPAIPENQNFPTVPAALSISRKSDNSSCLVVPGVLEIHEDLSALVIPGIPGPEDPRVPGRLYVTELGPDIYREIN